MYARTLLDERLMDQYVSGATLFRSGAREEPQPP